MMIMLSGRGLQRADWHVLEKRAPQYLRIYHMEGGEVRYQDSLESFSLRKGWLYVFPAQRAYELTQSPQDPISCMYLHADVFPYRVDRAIKIDPERHPDIRDVLPLLRNQLSGADRSCFNAFAMALLQLLIRDGFLSSKIDGLSDDSGALPRSVGSMSRQAGYSNEYFIRSFFRANGVTPYQYLLSQRMNEAIALMDQGLLLEEIAQRVGYSCAKSFSCAFRRRFGISPQHYRKYFLQRA